MNMWSLDETLKGVRVFEDANGSAAPFVGRLLAELGADVVKVEVPDGDTLRRGTVTDDGFCGAFEHANAGKRSITVDREALAGRELVDRLRAWADVLIVDREGHDAFTAADISRLKPTALVVAVTPFGLEGPRRGDHAGPRILFHEGGMLVDVRSRTQPLAPASPSGQFANFEAGALAAVGALAVLLSAETGQEGRTASMLLDVSVQDAVVHACRQDLMIFPNEGIAVAPRHGSVIGPFGAVIVQCVDGEVMTHVGRNEWNRFATLVGRDDWNDAFFLDPAKLQDDTRGVTARLREWASIRSREEVSHVATEAGFTVTAISTPLEALSDPQLAHRSFFVPATAASSYLIPRALPFRLTAADIGENRGRTEIKPAPEIGADAASILSALDAEDTTLLAGKATL